MTAPYPGHSVGSVLIVDPSEESRDVLRLILESRGVNIFEAKQGAEGLQIFRDRQPAVVVLDLEFDYGNVDELQDAFEDESRRQDSSLVVLGRLKRADKSPDDSRVIPKPYHYGPLVRTIEQLLERH